MREPWGRHGKKVTLVGGIVVLVGILCWPLALIPHLGFLAYGGIPLIFAGAIMADGAF